MPTTPVCGMCYIYVYIYILRRSKKHRYNIFSCLSLSNIFIELINCYDGRWTNPWSSRDLGTFETLGAQCAMFEGQGFKMLEKATKEEINAQELCRWPVGMELSEKTHEFPSMLVPRHGWMLFVNGKSHRSKWMMTRGTLMAMESPTRPYSSQPFGGPWLSQVSWRHHA